MNFFKNKCLLPVAFSAVMFFLSVSLGGEFLHDQIHHHATQDEHGDCPLYQLAVQLFFAVIFAFTAPVLCVEVFCLISKVFPSRICCAFSSPRAPPSLL